MVITLVKHVVFSNRAFGGNVVITIKKCHQIQLTTICPTVQSGTVGFEVSQSGKHLFGIQKENGTEIPLSRTFIYA